jgi:hypothetical protein
MPRLAHYPPIALALLLAFTFLPLWRTAQAASHRSKPVMPTVRWDERTQGCTFSRSDDGKLHYGLPSDDVDATLIIDSQELEKVRRRHEPFFSGFVTVRYRGHSALEVGTDNISLEYLKHFRLIQTALDPDAFAQKIQDDADTLDHETARYVQRHPEKREAKEAYVRAFQKDAAELIEFVSKNSLRPARLGSSNPEISGWLLFNANSRWIDGWKKQEEFILRIPLGGKIFEFPFALPPDPGDTMLRRRE